MRVAVIGGTGLLGAALCPLLREAGVEVMTLSRRHPAGWPHPWQPADLCHPTGLAAAFAGADAVVNLAGQFDSDAASLSAIHVDGVTHLIEACRTVRIRRLVHLSALRASPHSSSAFYRSKFAAEALLRCSGLDFTILRPTVLFGAGDRCIAPLARLARRLDRLPLIDLPALLQPVALVDAASACAQAIFAPETYGAAYDLPGPAALTLGEMIARVAQAIGLDRPSAIWDLEPLCREAPGIAQPPLGVRSLAEDQPTVGDSLPARLQFGLTLTRFEVPVLRSLLPGPAVLERLPYR